MTPESPDVVLAHDWLVSYRGSERVVEELARTFNPRRLLTTLVRIEYLPDTLRRAEPSLLQRLPFAAAHHTWFVPLMPLAWGIRKPVRGADIVISSSHACAKGVRVDSRIPHLCYCHTPMRYAWDFNSESVRFPRVLRAPARVACAALRDWDRRSADGVDQFVANSSAVAARVRSSYGRDAVVVHPPVRTDFFTPGEHVERENFFLFAGRLAGYKSPQILFDLFRNLPYELRVVGTGPLEATLRQQRPSNVTLLGAVDDEELRNLYRRAQGFIYPAEEDFGIVMAEAMAAGTPVVAVARGGALDIVKDGETGVLLSTFDARTLRRAIDVCREIGADRDRLSAAAQRFGAARFRESIRGVATEAIERGPIRGRR